MLLGIIWGLEIVPICDGIAATMLIHKDLKMGLFKSCC